jgi:hypothetical protein
MLMNMRKPQTSQTARTSNNSGFTVQTLVFSLVCVGIIIAAGLIVSHARHRPASAAASLTSNQYLDVIEWGVKMKLSGKLGNVAYTVTPDKALSVEDLHFSSSLDVQIPRECGSDCWGIVRNLKNNLDHPVSAYTKIGDYYYRYVYPQSGCNADTAGILAKLSRGYMAMFATLQAK